MTSYWDKVERRQKTAASHGTTLRDLQTELWGWCDERPRDGLRTRHNGWAGNLVRSPRRPRDDGSAAVSVVDDQFVPDPPVSDPPVPDAQEDEVRTLAELFKYVSAASDPGGSTYCATKTWYGSGLSDAFERLAERLSPAERRTAEQNMRALLPPCRNCGCQQTKLKKFPHQAAPKLRLRSPESSRQPVSRSEDVGERMFERSVRRGL
jgi:hypothetical protein